MNPWSTLPWCSVHSHNKFSACLPCSAVLCTVQNCTVQAVSDDNFHVGFNNIYDKNLARSLRNIFKKHAHLFKGLEDKYDLDLAANCTTIRGFDDAITRRTFGRKLSLQHVVAGSSIVSAVMMQNQCHLHHTVTSVFAVKSAAATQHLVRYDQHAPACMAACTVIQLWHAYTVQGTS